MWTNNPFKMGGASSQEPRAVTVEEVEDDDGQTRINVRVVLARHMCLPDVNTLLL